MSQLTLSLPESLENSIKRRMSAAGFTSKEDYLLELVRADCESAELEGVLEVRDAGPFEALEADWKDKVRASAQRRG
jgi:Arc/MetJ-type ribon-helix-helix transcriptional regulator